MDTHICPFVCLSLHCHSHLPYTSDPSRLSTLGTAKRIQATQARSPHPKHTPLRYTWLKSAPTNPPTLEILRTPPTGVHMHTRFVRPFRLSSVDFVRGLVLLALHTQFSPLCFSRFYFGTFEVLGLLICRPSLNIRSWASGFLSSSDSGFFVFWGFCVTASESLEQLGLLFRHPRMYVYACS